MHTGSIYKGVLSEYTNRPLHPEVSEYTNRSLHPEVISPAIKTKRFSSPKLHRPVFLQSKSDLIVGKYKGIVLTADLRGFCMNRFLFTTQM